MVVYLVSPNILDKKYVI